MTANSDTPRSGGIGPWVNAPEDRGERLTGDPAERFAKSLRGKLQRKYHELDHVKNQPFALAIADFHASGPMVLSRDALPTYLYGIRADVAGDGVKRYAVGTPINKLTGRHGIQLDCIAIPAWPICRRSFQVMRHTREIQPHGLPRWLETTGIKNDAARFAF